MNCFFSYCNVFFFTQQAFVFHLLGDLAFFFFLFSFFSFFFFYVFFLPSLWHLLRMTQKKRQACAFSPFWGRAPFFFFFFVGTFIFFCFWHFIIFFFFRAFFSFFHFLLFLYKFVSTALWTAHSNNVRQESTADLLIGKEYRGLAKWYCSWEVMLKSHHESIAAVPLYSPSYNLCEIISVVSTWLLKPGKKLTWTKRGIPV